LELQLKTLIDCGISEITVVVGFGAQEVEKEIKNKFPSASINIFYNPFYAISENLVSCWLAMPKMNSDFILLNGDTIFEKSVLWKALNTTKHLITVVIDQKNAYDQDDMKVIANSNTGTLRRIGKNIPLEQVNGEAIGLHIFRKEGALLFKDALEKTLRSNENAIHQWYLFAIDALSKTVAIGTCCIKGLRWAEIDFLEDLESARKNSNFFEAFPNFREIKSRTL
jgi:choline kinase